MERALLVRVVNCPGDGLHVLGRFPRTKRAVLHELGQGRPANELHREVGLPLELAHLVDPDDAGVVQVRCRLRLRVEAMNDLVVRQQPTEDHLQRHLTIQGALPGAIHDPHPAARDLLHDLVVADVAQARSRGEPGAIAPVLRGGSTSGGRLGRHGRSG